MKSRRRIDRTAEYIGESRHVHHAEAVPSRRENTSEEGRTYCIMALPQEPTYAPTGTRCKPVFPVREEKPQPREVTQPREILQDESALTVGRIARLTAGLLFTAAVITSPLWLTGEELLPVMKRLGAASAAVQLPPEQAVSAPDVPQEEVVEPTVTTTAQTTEAPGTAVTAAPQEDTEGLMPVSEEKVGGGTKVGSIYVRNSTGYQPDFGKIMEERADCRIRLNAGYQVLIVHTHTTEGYAQRADGLYSPDYSPRTTDSSQNMVAVGEVLAQQLESAGIRTLHAVEVHDYPQYNGSYDRAKTTIGKYLEQYPSIEMVLDVHRDAITYDDGTKLKPTAEINGRKAAQVMIISGCDAGGKLYFPEWKSNLCMALQIQQSAHSRYDGLMRPLSFAPYRYNMHMTPNSLLLEFGTDVNTLDEALYSAELMGQAIADVLLKYDVDK